MNTPIIRVALILLSLMAVQISVPCLSQELPSSVRYAEAKDSWPSSYSDQGVAKGIFPDSVRMVFESLGVELSIRLMPDIRTIPEIRSNHADIAVIITNDEVGLEGYPDFLHACETPFVQMDSEFVWLEGGAVEVHDYEDLSQYRIGTYRAAPVLLSQLAKDMPLIEYFSSVDALVKSLLSGRVDVVLLNWPQVQGTVQRLGSKQRIQRGLILKTFYFHLVIRRDWASTQEQLGRVCKRVDRLQRQGKFDEIFRAYYNLN